MIWQKIPIFWANLEGFMAKKVLALAKSSAIFTSNTFPE